MATPPAGGYRMPASDVREDGPTSAPDFSDSWSAGLASALEKADQTRAAAATAGRSVILGHSGSYGVSAVQWAETPLKLYQCGSYRVTASHGLLGILATPA